MSDGRAAPSRKLYTPRLLALSAQLANYPLDPTFTHTAEARSRTCGSAIALGLDCDAGDRVNRIGMQVSACAVGQSSAAILASEVQGKSASDIATALAEVEAWLEGSAPLPQWRGLDALEPAQAHPGRHGALLLPWKAAADALCTDPVSG